MWYTVAMPKFLVKKLDPQASLPVRQHDDDAAMDITTIESVTVAPGERHTFRTGFAAEFSPEFVALIRDRSSLGSKGIHVLAGVIDASYRGEWKIVILNTSPEPWTVQPGDRIAQVLLLAIDRPEPTEVQTLNDTSRGDGGFGSTGT